MNMEQLYPVLAALAVAVVSYLVSYLNNKKLKDKVNTIEQALQSDEATYYIYCPECKARIELNKVKILVDKQQNSVSNANNH